MTVPTTKQRIKLHSVKQRAWVEDLIAHFVDRHAKAVAERHPGHPDNAWGLADQMVGQILAHGPAYTRELYLPVAATIKGAMPALAASQLEYEINSATTIAMTLALVSQSLELPIGDDPMKELRPLLSQVMWSGLPQFNWQRGFVALAIGDEYVWRSVALLHAPQPLLFTPGLKFEFNCQGLLGYLGAAVANGASFADVEIAYRDYLFCYPTLRRMKDSETSFENLFLIAVIVHHLIGKHPLTAVPALLQADHLANLEPPPGTVVY